MKPDYPLKLADQLRPLLQALRRQRGLTQAQLGAAIGVTQARIVEIEAQPGVVGLQQIMQVLNVLGAGLVIRENESASDTPASAGPAGEGRKASSEASSKASITKRAPPKPASKLRQGRW